jgi:hypothetical protein
MKIAELDEAIKLSHPSMPTLLRDIHQNLRLDPENVTLLDSAQIAVIVNGLSKQTNTTITTSILSGAKGKALKKISVDDI